MLMPITSWLCVMRVLPKTCAVEWHTGTNVRHLQWHLLASLVASSPGHLQWHLLASLLASSPADFTIQDGGYHVPFAHKGLANGLQMDSYKSTLYERLSIQSCGPQRAAGSQDMRLGESPKTTFRS